MLESNYATSGECECSRSVKGTKGRLTDGSNVCGARIPSRTTNQYDAPGIPLIIEVGSCDGDWEDYVRFTPKGGIAVTLGRLDWNWAASCINTNPIISDTQLPDGWVKTSDGEDGPILHDDDSFPLWSHVYSAPPGE